MLTKYNRHDGVVVKDIAIGAEGSKVRFLFLSNQALSYAAEMGPSTRDESLRNTVNVMEDLIFLLAK